MGNSSGSGLILGMAKNNADRKRGLSGTRPKAGETGLGRGGF
jgi:hypothetical protein